MWNEYLFTLTDSFFACNKCRKGSILIKFEVTIRAKGSVVFAHNGNSLLLMFRGIHSIISAMKVNAVPSLKIY